MFTIKFNNKNNKYLNFVVLLKIDKYIGILHFLSTDGFLSCIGNEKILQDASLGDTYLQSMYCLISSIRYSSVEFPSSLETMETIILS